MAQISQDAFAFNAVWLAMALPRPQIATAML